MKVVVTVVGVVAPMVVVVVDVVVAQPCFLPSTLTMLLHPSTPSSIPQAAKLPPSQPVALKNSKHPVNKLEMNR